MISVLRWGAWYRPGYLLSLLLIFILRTFPWPGGRGRYWFKRTFHGLLFPKRCVPIHTDQGWLFLTPQEDVLQHQIYAGGTHYESKVVELVEPLVQPGMNVADIGGHAGYYALAFARRVGPTGKVWVFEPQPWLAEQIQRTMRFNQYHWAEVENLAVADQAGEITLNTVADSGRASIADIADGEGQVQVPAQSLDTFLAEKDSETKPIILDVIKCDIEGAEWLALPGMKTLLTAPSPPLLLLELHPQQIQTLGGSLEQLLDWLRGLDYELYPVDHRRGLLRRAFAPEDRSTEHVLAGHRDDQRLRQLLDSVASSG